jgi:hypothetical protein
MLTSSAVGEGKHGGSWATVYAPSNPLARPQQKVVGLETAISDLGTPSPVLVALKAVIFHVRCPYTY